MTTRQAETRRLGQVGVVAAVIAAVGLAWTWVLSVSDVLDPVETVRIGGILLLPLGLLVAVPAGAVAVLGTGRRAGLVALGISAVVVGLFTWLMFRYG